MAEDGFIPPPFEPKPPVHLYTAAQLSVLAVLAGPTALGWGFGVNYRRLERHGMAFISVILGLAFTSVLIMVSTKGLPAMLGGLVGFAQYYAPKKLDAVPVSGWRVTRVIAATYTFLFSALLAAALLLPGSALRDALFTEVHNEQGHFITRDHDVDRDVALRVLSVLESRQYFAEGVPEVTVRKEKEMLFLDFDVNDEAYAAPGDHPWALNLEADMHSTPGLESIRARFCGTFKPCVVLPD